MVVSKNSRVPWFKDIRGIVIVDINVARIQGFLQRRSDKGVDRI